MRLKVKIEDLPEFEIPVGEGKQSIKWLCWAAVQRARTVRPGGCLRVRDENLLNAQPHAIWRVAANANYRPNSDQEMEDGSLKPDLIVADVLDDGERIHLSLRKDSRPNKDGISPQSPWKKSASKMSSIKFSSSESSENSIGNQLMMNLPNSHPKYFPSRKTIQTSSTEFDPKELHGHWKNVRWLPAFSSQQTEADTRLQRELVDEIWKDIHIVKRCSSLEEKENLKSVLYSKFNHILNIFRFYSEPFGKNGATILNENQIPEMAFSDYLTFLQDNDIITKENSRWFRARVLLARAYSVRKRDVRQLEGMRTATDLFHGDSSMPAEPSSPRSADLKSDDKYPSISLSFFIDLIAETAAAIYASPAEAGSSSRSNRLQEYKSIFVEGYRPRDREKWPHFSPTMLADFCDKYLISRSLKTGNRHGIRSVFVDRSVCRRISENMGHLRGGFVEWCNMEGADQADGVSGKEQSQGKSRKQGRRPSATGEGSKSLGIVGLKMSFPLFEKALNHCQLYHPQEDNIVVSSVENTSYPPIEMTVKEFSGTSSEPETESQTYYSAFKSSMLYDLDDGRTLNHDDVALSFLASHVKDEALLGFNYVAQDSMISFSDTSEEFPYCSPKKADTARSKSTAEVNSSKPGASGPSVGWRDVDQSVWRKEFQSRVESGEARLCFTEFVEALMRLGFFKFENTRLSPSEKVGRIFDMVAVRKN